MVAKGVRTYSPTKDIVVQEQEPGRDGSVSWSKSIPLNDTFAISASVHRDQRLDGFGLVVDRRGDPNGFSGEWFNREEGAVFRKLQGPGRVSIVTRAGPGYEHAHARSFVRAAS